MVRHTEKAERVVKASQSRRAPNPGGAVQMNRNLERRPRKTKLVHRGRHDQPMTRPIMTASLIGTAQTKMSINVSVMVGFFQNSEIKERLVHFSGEGTRSPDQVLDIGDKMANDFGNGPQEIERHGSLSASMMHSRGLISCL
ncbi:hypothetical protein SLE2022_250330 [Rubroshorea leprosula]